MLLKDVESRAFLSIANRLPRIQILKFTVSGGKISNTPFSLVSLLIDNRLQSKLGTRRTELRVRSLDSTTEPVPATFDSEPSAIRTVKLFGHGLYIEKIVASPVI